ncbi:arginine ABC transporter ATP-binding protein ArtP [Psittacicella melopsittaci]|uniref:Arginine transport ATP-binding protein ArtP n=1 Tax=Psittacicella melopsittaci TaxID=2028576 RepID=A0A3A1Y2X1_9GAMM|nr:ATP-binding cassette domain-containing protein [Psittacicella melopsittaci]RIY31915.1 arginine ABC transporter ATP-binding protein ArtP [Psittacicella melopsittaci]
MHNIEVKNLNLFYGQTQALFDVNCSLEGGKVSVLLGKSGAGKSTFIRTLNLLELPSSGTLKIDQQVIDFSQKISDKQALLLRRKVGMVFQNYNLWPHKTVLENLIYAPVTLKLATKEQALKQAKELLAALQITAHADKYPLQLSGGQQQRVAICRALMMQPEVLLYDEPTAALDPNITGQVAKIIKNLSSTGVTQIIVTHDVGFARQVADKVYYFEAGRLVESGSAEQMFSNPQTPEFKEYLTFSK